MWFSGRCKPAPPDDITQDLSTPPGGSGTSAMEGRRMPIQMVTDEQRLRDLADALVNVPEGS
jgi:hypothetical protein